MRLASVFNAVTAFSLVFTTLLFTGCSGNPEKVLVFSPAPLREQVAGVPMVPFNVRIVDVRGEPLGDEGVPVTVTLKAGTDVLNGTLTVNTVGGTAVFDDVVYRTAEPITVDITAPGARPILDVPIVVIPNVPAQLAFATPPVSPVVAGTVWAPFTVELRDAYGNRINDSQVIALSVVAPPATGVLQGTTTVNAVRGVATFSDISYTVAEDIILRAESADLVATISLSVTVDPDATGPLHLSFSQQPQNGTTDSNQTIKVAILDQYNNVVTSRADVITLAIGVNPGTSVCPNCTAVAAVDGVATFSNIKLNRPGVGYTLTATAGVPISATLESAPFNLTHGAPASVVWVDPVASTDRSPVTTQTAGVIWTPVAGASVAAFVLDQDGNLTTLNNSTSVKIERQGNPADPAFVSNTVTVSGGVAQFSAVTYNVSDALPITVQAVSAGLAPSPIVNVTVNHGPAASLNLTTPPGSTNADASQVVGVTVRDALGNVVTSPSAGITLTVTTPCGASLATGTGPVLPVSGVASFSLQVGRACTGYTLSASNGVQVSPSSAAFDITHGAATNLNYAIAPVTNTADTRQTVHVEVRDQFNNRVTTGADSSVLVNLSIGTNGGAPVPGSLVGYTPQAANLGLARFEQSQGGTGVQINRRGAAYTLVASATVGAGAINTVSGPFTITPGAATKVTFDPLVSPLQGPEPAAAQPVNGSTDTLQAPIVKILDQFNNTVTDDSSTTVTLSVNSGPTDGFCLNCIPVTASNGVANFSAANSFRLSKPGTYTIRATTSSGSIATANSNAIVISVGAPHHLKYGTAPLSQQVASRRWDNFTVQIVDEFGNLIPTATGSISIGLTPGGSPSGNGGQCPSGPFAELCGTITRSATGGVATFDDIFYNTAEVLAFTASCAGCVAPVNANGLSSDTTASTSSAPISTSVDVRPDVVDRLAFVPANSPAAVAQTAGSPWGTFEVRVEDSHGNVIPTSRDITIQVISGCQNEASNFIDNVNVPPDSFKRTAILGVATFTGIQANCAGNVVITAVSGALAAADPITVQVNPLTVQRYAFIQEPVQSARVSETQILQVAVIDQFDNIVTTDNSTPVVLDVAVDGANVPPATCVLGCVGATTMVNGVATIPFRLNRVGQGYVLEARHPLNPTPNSDLSSAFELTPGDPFQLSFSDASGTSYAPVSPQRADLVWTSASNPLPVTVHVLDQDGNLCTQIESSDSIFIDIAQTGGAITNGGFSNESRRVVGGIAQFPGLVFRTSTGVATMDVYAQSLDVPNDTSNVPVQVQNGLTAALSFVNQPNSGAELNADGAKPITIAARDAYGNLVETVHGTDPANQTLSMLITPNSTNARFVVGGVAQPVNSPLTAVIGGGSGQGTFQLWIAESGSNYRVTVSNGVHSVTSDPFTNVNGVADHLFYARQPTNANAGVSQLVTVNILDQWNNLVQQTPSGALPANQHNQQVDLNLIPGAPAPNCLPACPYQVNAVGGVANFQVALDTDSLGNRMEATATVTGQTLQSNTFNIQPGNPANIVFQVPPNNVTTDDNQTIVVRVNDDFGNAINTPVTVTLSLSPDPLGNRCETGCGSAVTASGLATFNNVRVNTPGTYTLVAAVNIFGLSAVPSNSFVVSVGAPSRIEFGSVPASQQVAGQTWTTFTARFVDFFGNTVTQAGNDITVSPVLFPLGGQMFFDGGGDTKLTDASGIATFSQTISDRIYALVAGDYTFDLTTTVGGVSAYAGYPVRVIGDTPDQITIDLSGLGANQAAGDIWPDFTVSVRDAYGNIVPTSRPVTIEVSAPGTQALLDFGIPATPTRSCVAGTATFGPATGLNLSYERAETIGIRAYSGSLAPTTIVFSIVPGLPNALRFASVPTDGSVDLQQTVTVAIVDSYDNIVTSGASDSITLSITPGTGNPGAVLSTISANPGATAAGVATFNLTQINRPNVNVAGGPFPDYQLRASGGTYGVVDMDVTDAFTRTHGVPDHLRFLTSPVNAQVTDPLSVQVQLEDQFDNVAVTSSATITLGVATGPGGAQFVNGSGSLITPQQVTASGIATYANTHLNLPGAYELNATGGGLPLAAPSASFTLTEGPAAKLAIVTQPTTPIRTDQNQTVDVAVKDLFGNTLTGDNTTSVQLSIASGPVGGDCSPVPCPISDTATAGIVTFNAFQLTRPGTYTMTAGSGVLISATTNPFTVTPGLPDSIVFASSPVDRTTDQTQSIVLNILDVHGNIATNQTAITTVTLSIGTTPAATPDSNPAVVLTGGGLQTPIGGVVTYPNVRINSARNGYQLEAITDGPALNTGLSAAFNITPGVAAKLAFVAPNDGIDRTADQTQQFDARVLDQNDNTVTTDNGRQVTLAFAVDPSSGTSNLTNGAGLIQPTVGGYVSFTTARVSKALALAYRLQATAAGLTPGLSNFFTITHGAPALLTFEIQPSSTTADLTQTVSVAVRDQYGNLHSSATPDDVELTISPSANPGATALTPTDPIVVTPNTGIAAFAGVQIPVSANGYRLRAQYPDAAPTISVDSNAFNIAAGVATQLAFITSPVDTTADLTQSIEVELLDTNGNRATSATNPVTLVYDGTFPAVPVLDTPTVSGGEARSPSNGIVIFPNVRLNKAGADFRLQANANGLISDLSDEFDIAHGFRDALVFDYGPDFFARSCTSPGASTAGPVDFEVCLIDDYGNLVDTGSGANGLVTTLSYAVNAGGSTGANLNPSSVTAGGIALFNARVVNKAGVGYITKATAGGGITDGFSKTFDVAAGAATQLLFVQQPTNGNTDTVETIQVAGVDSYENIDPAYTNTIDLTKTTGPGGCFTGCPASQAAVAGIATFSNVRVQQAGTHQFTAEDLALVTPTRLSNLFNRTPGSPYRPAFLTVAVPSWTTNVTRQIQVVIEDEMGNTVSNATNTVSLSINSFTPDGSADPAYVVAPQVLTGAAGVSAVGGVATFGSVGVNSIGSYDLIASAVGTTVPVSPTVLTVAVTPGPAYQLAIDDQPSNVQAGANIAPAVTVVVLDQKGNHAYTATTPVSLAIDNNPGSATLSGAGPLAAVGGVATFASTSLNKAGSDYTLVAKAALTSNTSAPSVTFDVTPNATLANWRLAFTVQPQDGSVDSLQTVMVAVQDQFGNTITTDNGRDIDLAVSSGPGACVGGCVTEQTVNGIATFTNVQIDTPGLHRLSATDSSATPVGTPVVLSSTFNLTFGQPTQLAFVTGPANSPADQTQQVQVGILDQFGNPVTTATNQVTISLSTNPGPSALTGGGTVTAVGGVATYAAVGLNVAANGYELTATSPGLTSGTSGSFDISAGSPARLEYGVAVPGAATAGSPFGPFTIRVVDSQGNLVTSATSQVQITVGSGPSGYTAPTAVLQAAVAGVATFNPVLYTAGTYTLIATSPGLTSSPASNSVIVSPAAADRLVFSAQPANATTDTIQNLSVTVQDAYGNTVPLPGETADIVINIGPGSCVGGCPTTLSLATGTASFSVQIDTPGVHRLATTNTAAITNATSSSFTVSAGLPAQLAFVSGPVTTAADQTQTIQIAVQDQFGNLSSSGNYAVTLSKGACSGSLTGGGVAVSSAGIASFPSVGVTTVQGACQLVASAPGLISDNASFQVIPGSPASAAITTQPGAAHTAGAGTINVDVTLYDIYGNQCATSNVAVVLEIITNPAGGSLSGGTTALTDGSCIASFAGLSINKAGSGYKVRGRKTVAPSFSTDPSDPFDINPDAATNLVFLTQPSAATTDTVQTVSVVARDANGNTDTSYVNSVTVSVNTGAGSLYPADPSVNAINGIATFSGANGIRVDGLGAHTLLADDGTLSTTSNAFSVSAGTATSLAFLGQPANATADDFQTISVELQDFFGHPTTGSNTVVLSINPANNPGGSTLTGGGAVQAVNGVVTWDSVNLNKAGTGYRLRATSTGLTTALSDAALFDITHGAAASVQFGQQPTTVAANTNIAPAVTVRLLDGKGNLVDTGAMPNATITIATNPGAATLGGGGATAFVAGVATFNALQLNKTGNGYVLQATSGSFTANSAGFNVTAGAPAALAFVNTPAASQTAGVNWLPNSGTSVSVAVVDAGGNVVTTDNSTIITITETGTGSFVAGTDTAVVINGTATFPLLKYNTAESFTVSADEAGALANPAAVNVTVSPATAFKLGFVSEPGAGPHAISANGLNFTVAIQDQYSNTVNTASASVTMTIGVNPGAGSIQGAGALPVATAAGLADWSVGINGISINRPGVGYRLQASAVGLVAALSSAFTLTHGAADSLVFTSEPSSATTDDLQSYEIRVLDFYGNLVTTGAGAASPVTVILEQNVPPVTNVTGASCASGCVVATAATGGILNVNNLQVQTVGNNFRLNASSGVLTPDTTGYFNIGAGTPDHLEFLQTPFVLTEANTTMQFVAVGVYDASSNLMTSATGDVTLSVSSGALNSASLTKAVSGGYAVWDDLEYDTDATTFDLTATLSAPVLTVTETITTGAYDVTDRDLTRISRAAGSADAPNNESSQAAISGNGRYVVFRSMADDVQSDITTTALRQHIYWVDRDADGDGIYDETGPGEIVSVLVSLSDSFTEGNAHSFRPSISGDGRYVSFASLATNLVSSDTADAIEDCYVRDMVLNVTEKITIPTAGIATPADGNSAECQISASGRFLVFRSVATNLVASDINGAVADVFVHDRVLGTTEIVSLTSAGAQIAGASQVAGSSVNTISADGRRVLFLNGTDGVVSGDTGGFQDLYLRDRVSGTTTRVSVNRNGLQLNGTTTGGSISADGSRVAFSHTKGTVSVVTSPATTGGRSHVYLRTVASALSVQLVSITDDETAEGDDNSFAPAVSADGNFVAFHSNADNLHPAGQNQFESTVINVFVRDIGNGRTLLLSTDTANTLTPDSASSDPSISLDGRYVIFQSLASNLFGTDANALYDILINGTSDTPLP